MRILMVSNVGFWSTLKSFQNPLLKSVPKFSVSLASLFPFPNNKLKEEEAKSYSDSFY